MQLKDLLKTHGRLDWQSQDPLKRVGQICTDSRQLNPDSVFVAIRGHAQDGHDFLPQMTEPLALVVESRQQIPKAYKGAILEVLDTRLTLQVLLQRFFGAPGDELLSVAVTGTNGKTSCTYMVEHLLQAQGLKCGVIGTIDHHLESRVWDTALTSPSPQTLQARLKDFVTLGADAFVIEVSSHALDQKRIHQGFDVCLFTNLSRDHLDYHGSLEAYFESKAKLFNDEYCKEGGVNLAVINGADPASHALKKVMGKRHALSFGPQGGGYDFEFEVTDSSIQGSHFTLHLPKGKSSPLFLPLIGNHNVENMVGALASVYALGGDFQKALDSVSKFPGVPGRLQPIHSKHSPYISAFVDYAHTPDALDKVLSTLKPVIERPGRLIVVFGCGGDRDPGKRPLMAEAASRWADLVILTSDNPRSEDPKKIIDEAAEGLAQNRESLLEVDRRKAIEQAVTMAKKGDVILVAGKGHEKTQTIGSEVRPFDDAHELSHFLQERGPL